MATTALQRRLKPLNPTTPVIKAATATAPRPAVSSNVASAPPAGVNGAVGTTGTSAIARSIASRSMPMATPTPSNAQPTAGQPTTAPASWLDKYKGDNTIRYSELQPAQIQELARAGWRLLSGKNTDTYDSRTLYRPGTYPGMSEGKPNTSPPPSWLDRYLGDNTIHKGEITKRRQYNDLAAAGWKLMDGKRYYRPGTWPGMSEGKPHPETGKIHIPDINAFLAGDTDYAAQKSAIDRALADYTTQYNTQLGHYKTDYAARTGELDIAKQRGQRDAENDFAGRGLLTSGLYAQNAAELSGDFDRQAAEMARALAEYQSTLAGGKQNFETEQQLALQRARDEAIARRAAKYGL